MNPVLILRERAALFAAVRRFFSERKVLEVDCPILHPCASVDAHIDLLSAFGVGEERYYLHSSPEYGMKKLLSLGVGDIYQMSHVFRDGERGDWHHPEFTMLEWYRLGFSLGQMIDETVELISLFLGPKPKKMYTYRQVFREFLGVDPFGATVEELSEVAGRDEEDRDILLHFLMAERVEPLLRKEEYTVVTHFPESQAALAEVVSLDGVRVAERFEVYALGKELANGYHELRDTVEQRERLEQENARRMQLGKETYPIDDELLEAMERGIPDCSGVAVGFDRLLQIRLGTLSIREVQSGYLTNK